MWKRHGLAGQVQQRVKQRELEGAESLAFAELRADGRR
jgi:hypothetical protein